MRPGVPSGYGHPVRHTRADLDPTRGAPRARAVVKETALARPAPLRPPDQLHVPPAARRRGARVLDARERRPALHAGHACTTRFSRASASRSSPTAARSSCSGSSSGSTPAGSRTILRCSTLRWIDTAFLVGLAELERWLRCTRGGDARTRATRACPHGLDRLHLRPVVERIASRPFSRSNDAWSVHGGRNEGARARLRPGLRQRPGPADRWDVGALAAFSVVLVRGAGVRLGERAYDRATLAAYFRSRVRAHERIRLTLLRAGYDPTRNIVNFAGKLVRSAKDIRPRGPQDFKGAADCLSGPPDVDRLEHVAPRFLRRNLARVQFPLG